MAVSPVTFIAPPVIKPTSVKRSIDRALYEAMEIAKAEFSLTYWSWESENQPEFQTRGPVTHKGDRVMYYWTDETPYIWVDWGTKGPYPIPKTPDGPLGPFQTGFVPKTSPGRLTAGPGASFGPWVSPKQVMHPGIEPRHFSIQVSENVADPLARFVNANVLVAWQGV